MTPNPHRGAGLLFTDTTTAHCFIDRPPGGFPITPELL